MQTSEPPLHPSELAALLADGHCQLVDVREPVEHAESHIAGATLIPLGRLDSASAGLEKSRPVIVMCQSGKRGAAAAEKLRALGFPAVRNLDGGILAWKAAGLPCAGARGSAIPLMRQVQIAVGSFVLLGSLLALTVNPAWVYLCMFFGAGLLFAGLSGFCGLAMLLARMPWNRIDSCCGKTSCQS